MPSIRKTKTGSGHTAVQVVRYENRRIIILKHIGSGHSVNDIAVLVQKAEEWIQENTAQQLLFPQQSSSILNLNSCRFLGVKYTFAYEFLTAIAKKIGFMKLQNPLLVDIIIMRIFEPCSKLRSILLMKRFFGISYSERSLYRSLPLILSLKNDAEKLIVSFAKKKLACNLSFVLYDATTLYFESFEPDDLRKPGFSKDNKSNQPQIVIGLLVNAQGFPLGYEIFKGNTFEGHTMIPVINAFCKAHKVDTCTVVGDAAMLSLKNIEDLKRHGLSYIVGARVANLSFAIISSVSESLKQHDLKTVRKTTAHGELIFEFSAKRFRKDRTEMKKQVAKAKNLIASKETGKRAKFVAVKNGAKYIFNTKLLQKTKSLLGIKGYYTNIPEMQTSDQGIISHYHNLWHVEQSFRMTKSDLVARPIFHYKEDSVRAHMLICFMALAMVKFVEIRTGLSVRRLIDILRGITDAHILDTSTRKEVILRSEIPEDTKKILKKLSTAY